MSSPTQELAPLSPPNLCFALDQCQEGIVLLDARSTLPEVLFANVRAGEILGHSQESLMTLSVADFYDHAHLEDLIRKLPVVAEKDRTFETEKELHRADGRTVLCRWTVSGTIGEDGIPQLYVLTFQPSVPKGETPTHGLPASIDAMKDRSRIEALAVLTLSMAHDFNNVLASLGINLALAQVAPGATDEVKESLSRAEASFQTAQALTMQLLTVAKGSAPERSEAHLGKMLQHAEGLAMLDPSVRCEIQVANHLWLCSVEETQILQVFHNLLVNARQAMAERGGVIQASCENRELKDGVMPELPEGNYVVVTLRDEGCGIPEEKLTKIFDTFFTTKEGGTGLGLAACRTAIERHAGAITVRSKVGVGTEFQIFLPAAEPTREPDMVFDEEVPSLVVEREETPSTSFFGDGSILVVDDQDDVRKAAVLLLEAMGYEATPAPSGEDAIQLYLQRLRIGRPFSAIIMDMTLPGGMSGEETLRGILSMDPGARAIATSGLFEEGVEELRARGYAAVLPKPFTGEELSQVLGAALAS